MHIPAIPKKLSKVYLYIHYAHTHADTGIHANKEVMNLRVPEGMGRGVLLEVRERVENDLNIVLMCEILQKK